MHCENYDTEVEASDCPQCETNNECDQYYEMEKEIAKKKLRDSEFGKAMLDTVGKIVGISDERVNSSIKDMVNTVFRATTNQINECISKVAQAEAIKYIEKHSGKMLDEAFDKAVAENTLFLKKDDSTVTQTVQKIVMERVKNFFYNSESKGRTAINDSVERLIQNSVSEKVDEAIEEIKKESIEMFNKEAMKKMMQGMAKALGQDKRLLTMLCNEEG